MNACLLQFARLQRQWLGGRRAVQAAGLEINASAYTSAPDPADTVIKQDEVRRLLSQIEEPEVSPEARRWSASEARAFLTFTKDDPLGLLFRIVLLRGARRGEAVGLRWADADLDAGYVRVRRPIVLVQGAVTESTPKTKTGDRLIWLDAQTVRILKEHRMAQLKARRMMGERWQDSDLIFCQGDGTPYKPDAVTRRFKRLAALAGLPVIKLHEGRHSAASLARDAAVDPEIRRRTLGHADAAMTAHYTHIEAEAHKAAAEAVAKLVESASS